MDETEWLACTTLKPMAEFLNFPHADERTRWLFACACCRRIWSLMSDERSRRIIELRERNADGLASQEELWQAIEAAAQARNEARAPFRFLANFDDRSPEAAPAWAAAAASTNAGTSVHFVLNAVGCVALEGWKAGREQEEAALCAIVRDILGNPFHSSVVHPDWLAWKDATIPKLAQAIYDDRTFDRLPILADALEEAGCTNADILAHCRKPGEHVRGCWVVDLLLGKS